MGPVLLTIFNLFLIGINGLILMSIVNKSAELRIRRQAKKEGLYMAYNRNWRNR